MTRTILIVDDDPVQRRLLASTLEQAGFATISAEDGVEGLQTCEKNAGNPPDLMILDLVMPRLDGLGVLKALEQKEHTIPVIVQTANGSIDNVVAAMRAGAFDFIVKPLSPQKLIAAVNHALRIASLGTSGEARRRRRGATLTFKDLVTKSPRVERVIQLGQKAAKSRIPILIEGESGAGKEVIARAIQGSSDRRTRPFVPVNCGAIPENLIESTLFGHEKGAFTGAIEKHKGKFQEADSGTLFLDEVGELSADIQVRLLRTLQEGEVEPVGSGKPVKVDFRLISATHRSLLDMVKAGEFREDLYYRLNVFPIHVPPLRERREDIPDLAGLFLERFAASERKKQLEVIGGDAMDLLCAYDWPGNIRQLENTIFRAVVLSEGNALTLEDFPTITAQMDPYTHHFVENVTTALQETPARKEPVWDNVGHTAVSAQGTSNPLDISPAHATEPQPDTTAPPDQRSRAGHLPMITRQGDLRSLNDMEADIIRYAILHCNGRMSEVARKLGIGRSTLYRKLKEFSIDADEIATGRG